LTTVHLSTAPTWRGGENQVFLLARGLPGHGHTATVIAPRGAPLLERCREAQVPVRELNARGLLGAWRLSRLIRKLRPDILHAHDGHAVIPAKLALHLAGAAGRDVKLVAHRRTIFRLKSRSKYSGRVDCVIAISNAAKAELVKMDIPEKNCRVVYSGIECPKPLPRNAPDVLALRRMLGIQEGAFIIAHAAALTAEKRQADMIDALAKLNARLGAQGVPPKQHAHLVIAGSGPLLEDLQRRAMNLGLNDRYVHFTGFSRELKTLWALADVALFASEAEGLCTALIEAQAAGLPAVVSNVGGMPEVIEDGATGVIFEIGDVDAMARALAALETDSARRLRMGAQASARARAHFSSAAMIDGVAAVYKELKGKA